MIRPRTGDFLYTPYELDVMVDDIRMFKALGADGVVFGVLRADGWIDVEQTRMLAEEADGMQSEITSWLYYSRHAEKLCSMLPQSI